MSENQKVETIDNPPWETPAARAFRIILITGIFIFAIIMRVGLTGMPGNIGIFLIPVAGVFVTAWITWHWLKEIRKIKSFAARLLLYVLALIAGLVLASNFFIMIFQFAGLMRMS